MSRVVLLTHTQKPLESWFDFHMNQYHLLWLPLVKFLFKKPSFNLTDYQHVILSSPTSIEWLSYFFEKKHIIGKSFYVVGQNSAQYFERYFPNMQYQIYRSSKLSMKVLLEDFFLHKSDFLGRKERVLWLGSNWGVLKHQSLLFRIKNLRTFITHWNWPKREFSLAERMNLLKADKVVISSFSAALSLNFFEKKNNIEKDVILSSDRLEKYLGRRAFDIGPWASQLSKNLL